jgi:TonB family protein
VFKKPVAGGGDPGPKPKPPAPGSPPPATDVSKGKKKSSSEFLIVAVIAVAVLVAGGWFVMKTRAENAEKSRIAAELKHEADRKAEEIRLATAAREAETARQNKLEQERLDKLSAQLRGELAEIRVRWEVNEREAQTAERRLAELKSDLRSLRDATRAQQAEAAAEVEAQQAYADWLSSFLLRHPTRTVRARAEELISARAMDEAAAAMADLGPAFDRMEVEIKQQRTRLLATGAPVEITSSVPGLVWSLRDAYGRTRKGTTPGRLPEVPFGRATVTVQREGWPDIVHELVVRRGEPAVVTADYEPASLTIESTPPGATVRRNGIVVGVTPMTLADLPPGPVKLQLTMDGRLTARVERELTMGSQLPVSAHLPLLVPGAKPRSNLGVTLSSSPSPVIGALLPRSPAERADLRSGDTIVALHDMPIASSAELHAILALLPPGTVTTVTVLRAGDKIERSLTTGALPPSTRTEAVPNHEVDQGVAIISQPPPVYPPAMIRANIEGRVIIEFVVGASGEVVEAVVVGATHDEFGEAALAAARSWKFQPARKNGRPVPIKFTLEMPFTLTN